MTNIIESPLSSQLDNPNIALRENLSQADFHDANLDSNINSPMLMPVSHTDSLPIDASAPTNRSGNSIQTFSSVFYNHIIIDPIILNVGSITTDQTRPINVWNAFFIGRDLTDVEIEGDDSLIITGLDPHTFRALEEQDYQLQIGLVGPPTINATVTFTFDGGDVFIVPVVGRRVVPYMFQPIEEIEESLAWNTNIITSYNGKEQRIRVRPGAPKQVYSIQYEQRDINRFKSNMLIQGWLSQVWAIPTWVEGEWLRNVTLTAGTTNVYLDTTKSDFRVDSLVAFIAGPGEDENELSEVKEVYDDRIVLKYELASDIVNPYVLPVRLMISNNSVERSVYANQSELNRTKFDFIVTDVKTVVGEAIYPIFRGLYVLETQPLRADSAIGDTYLNEFSINNPITGFATNMPKWNKTKYNRPFSFRIRTSDFWDFKSFLYEISGRLVPFFMPSFEDDLNIVEDIESANTSIMIERIGYYEYGDSSTFRYVRLELYSGDIYYSKITSASLGANPEWEELSLEDLIGHPTNITISEIKICSLMCIARFDSDTLTFNHNTAGYTTFTLPIKGIDYDA